MSAEDLLLLKAFPFGFTLNKECRISKTGRSLQRLNSILPGNRFEDVIEVLLPSNSGLDFDKSRLCDRLCVIRIRDSDIELRGEFIAHESDPDMVSFAGTLNVTTAREMHTLGVKRSDVAHHDMLIDLVTLCRAHNQHVSDLDELNTRLTSAIELKNKYQAAESAVSKQLKLAADLRLIVDGMNVIEFQAKEATTSLTNEDPEIAKDTNIETNVDLFHLIPPLRAVNGLSDYLNSDEICFSFDFEKRTNEKTLAYEGECQRLDDNNVLILIRDITRQRELQRNLEFRANYDQLTGLANREVLFKELSAVYNTENKEIIDSTYLLIIDLDNFKSVNDILGHAAGDRLLQLSANRIKESVRNNDLVTRLGGDEFAVIIRNVNDNDKDLKPLLTRMESYMSREVDLRGFNWSPESSMGVAPLSSAKNASEILKNADLTMYDAKRAGKASVHHYSNTIKDRIVADIKIQHGLKQGIKDNQLSAEFQPVFELSTNRMVALESLARWKHPELGPVAPDRFIELAEKSDLIFACCVYLRRQLIRSVPKNSSTRPF